MLRKIVRLMPPKMIRFFGYIQFKLPFLKPLINKVGQSVMNGEGVIRYGVGAGLKLDATGGFPGYIMGTTEPEEQEALASVLKPGGVFYDIGANIGFYAVIAGRIVGEAGHVYAFEPFAESVAMIEKNAGLNQMSHITAVPAAATDTDGTVKLGVTAESALHTIRDDINNPSEFIEVKAVAVDTCVYQENFRKPTVVMIDVEGAELYVLRGMKRTLQECRPALLIEVHWLGKEFTDYIEKEILPLGYTVTQFDGSALPEEIVRYHAFLRPTG
jgi:FkbM family methyltransferase